MRENRHIMKRFLPLRALVVLAISLVALAVPSIVRAACSNPDAQSCSTSYQVNETFFGSGGDLQNCSFAYCAKTSVGDLGVGNSKGTLYQAQAGFNTDRTPYLEFNVTGSSADLGVLSVGSTATANTSFSVKTYLAGGYVLTTESDPPASTGVNAHTFNNLASSTASSPGTEQFGINLVANTSPTTFGASPVQVPDSSFSFGTFASGYGTANQYKYNKGDTIAQSTKSTGQTNFTVSYIFNISNVTPSGQYTFHQTLVATSTY